MPLRLGENGNRDKNRVWNGTLPKHAVLVSILYIFTSVSKFSGLRFQEVAVCCMGLKKKWYPIIKIVKIFCFGHSHKLYYTGTRDITVHHGLQKSWLHNQWWCWFWCNPASPASQIVSEIHPERESHA